MLSLYGFSTEEQLSTMYATVVYIDEETVDEAHPERIASHKLLADAYTVLNPPEIK